MGANELLSPEDVDAAEALIARSQVVMSVLEIKQETAARAMELGRKNGALTILNPAPAERLDPSVFANIDLLTPNQSELRILLGLSPDDPTDTLILAKRLQAQGIRNIVVTLGSRGALVVEAGKEERVIAGTAVKVTDTTGAGDAFNAALAFALANKRPLLDAVQFAAAAGALACTKLGVIPALPYLNQVEAFISQARPS
jgi:ribokinase